MYLVHYLYEIPIYIYIYIYIGISFHDEPGVTVDVRNPSIVNFTLRKEGNILFNNALNTFHLRLFVVRYNMVIDHLDSERKPAAATSF